MWTEYALLGLAALIVLYMARQIAVLEVTVSEYERWSK